MLMTHYMASLTRRVSCSRTAARSALLYAALSSTLAAPALGQALRDGPGTEVFLAAPCSSEVRPLGFARQLRCPSADESVKLVNESLATALAHGPKDLAWNRATATEGSRTARWVGAGIGALVGSITTYVALESGGSTGLCDQDANQDAVESRYCVGLYTLGGLAGGGLGWLVAGLFAPNG